MLLDQLSVLVAIGFSGASLGLTFFMMWAIGRSENMRTVRRVRSRS